MGFIVENNRSPLGCALGLGIVFNDNPWLPCYNYYIFTELETVTKLKHP